MASGTPIFLPPFPLSMIAGMPNLCASYMTEAFLLYTFNILFLHLNVLYASLSHDCLYSSLGLESLPLVFEENLQYICISVMVF